MIKVSYLPVVFLLLSLASGCTDNSGPQRGAVEGVVTLDGQPLANASVAFVKLGSRPAMGYTDEQGHYELQYLPNKPGAVMGEHTVMIDRVRSEGQVSQSHLPARYNEATELKADVQPGHNKFNFDLTSN